MNVKFYIRNGPLFAYLYLFLTFGIGGLHPASGQSFTNAGEIIQISGNYSHIFKNNNPWIINNFHFVALTAFDEWSISATNDNNPKDWGVMRYDGTNIYRLGTDAGNAPPGSKNSFKAYGFVFPGQFYVPDNQDSTHFFLPWMAFHLTPQMIQHSFEHNRVIQMPLPWSNSRYSLLDHGCKWILKSFDDNQIIQRIDIVRDSVLDLKTEEDELRRSILDYPFEISSRDDVLHMLQIRKGIPNGFIEYSYECTEVCHTNNLAIPFAAQFIEFWPNYKTGGIKILSEYTFRVDGIELLNGEKIPDLTSFETTRVSDYRYQSTNSRTKYNYASYILNAGDQFKSDKDPKLLADAQHWLKRGPGYDSYRSKRGIILAGMLAITIITSGLLLLFRLKPAK